MLFAQVLRKTIRRGRLTVIDAHGRHHDLIGTEPGKHLIIKLHRPDLSWKLAINPQLSVGEAYMDGLLTVENDDIYGLMDFVGENLHWNGIDHWSQRLGDWVRHLNRYIRQFNPAGRSKRNVAHHYDLSDELYETFLDSNRQYSCAYFVTPDDSLEQAQQQKMRHIAAKLLLQPGQKVLDIGSGWGGLALHLAAAVPGLDVTGVTLSEEQLKYANARARREGLSDRVRFELRDYRAQQGAFDRIVSVGMFEHVGVNHYQEFFATVRRLLVADGVALLHTIGRVNGPGPTNPWIDRYIFPGGSLPALSEMVPPIERSNLCITDIETLRLHYAETLKHWRARFLAKREQVTRLYDARFVRMWELYLAASETAFRHFGHVVFQIQLARDVDAVPLTRDYIQAYEANR